jgi:ribosome biogenesis GTPase A
MALSTELLWRKPRSTVASDARTLSQLGRDLATAERLANGLSERQKQNAVLVVGGTGAGKSTLVNYLVGKRMVRTKVTGSLQYGYTCEDPVVEIGHGFQSMTSSPQAIPLVYGLRPLTLIDCPGFHDK